MIPLNEEKAKQFLSQTYSKTCNILKIAGDASFRSYYRISGAEKTAILMFAPPAVEDIKPFIAIDEFLVQNNFSAPKIYAKDYENGFLLLEDFGDNSYGKVLAKNPEIEFNLYQKACDCLIELHKIPAPANVKSYNHLLLFREVMLFIDWFLQLKKITISQPEIADFKYLWFDLFDQLSKENHVLVLRDYHADNLMILDNHKDYRLVGLLDFQDAVIGCAAYDLVSLLEDARRDVEQKTVEKTFNYYLTNCPFDNNSIAKDYSILSLQRNIKILGIFARLSLRDNKHDYLKLLPRVIAFVKTRLQDHKELGKLINKYLP